MALFPNFKVGFKTYSDAHRMIVKHRLWVYVFFPAIINLVMILLLIFVGWHFIGLFSDWLFNITGLNAQPTGFFKYLAIIFKIIVKVAAYILLFLFYSSIYRYIVLAIISPALAVLSEKTDKILTGINYQFRFSQFLKDVIRGIAIVLRNFFIEMGFLILCFFIGFIPVIGYISPVVMFFITCYFYGFSMIDYSNERARLSLSESVKFVRKNRGMAVANGMVFYFIFFFIPVIGFMVAPAYSVIAATIAVSKQQNSIPVIVSVNENLNT
ncbi:MAG: EI24 domain-containing protein [Bacteroidota bacterium]